MRSHSRIPDLQVAMPIAAPRNSKRRLLARVGAKVRSIIDWLRAGYAEEAPETGYSPLIALNGPIALTPKQKVRVVDELQDGPADILDIEVAITKATDRLPTPTQIHAIARALHRPPSRH